jgi:hypothetical protein
MWSDFFISPCSKGFLAYLDSSPDAELINPDSSPNILFLTLLRLELVPKLQGLY